MRFVALSVIPILAALCGGHSPAVVANDHWREDVATAVSQAREQQKDLLLLYTGSDWCPPCKMLEKEVFAEDDFYTRIGDHFVLVKFDYPREIEQSDALRQQNSEWAEKYGIAGYPTIVLADAQLRPYGITGYQPGGVDAFVATLDKFRQAREQRDASFAAAEKATGAEQAQLLDRGLSELDPQLVQVYYEDIVQQIVAIDANDGLGLRSKWNAERDAELRKIVMADILMVSRLEKPARALDFIDEVIGEIQFPPSDLLDILQIKLTLVRQLDDASRLDALLDQMIELEGITEETRERLIVKKIMLMVGTDRAAAARKLLDDSISGGGSNLYLYICKGELLAAEGQHEDAVKAFDEALQAAAASPDILIELTSAKADSLFALGNVAGALQTLDNFSENSQLPSDLRVEALLHKAMIMRDTDRERQARLAENRAIEISGSPEERAETEKIVQRLRRKYEDSPATADQNSR